MCQLEIVGTGNDEWPFRQSHFGYDEEVRHKETNVKGTDNKRARHNQSSTKQQANKPTKGEG